MNEIYFLTAPGPDNWTIQGQPMLYKPPKALPYESNLQPQSDEVDELAGLVVTGLAAAVTAALCVAAVCLGALAIHWLVIG